MTIAQGPQGGELQPMPVVIILFESSSMAMRHILEQEVQMMVKLEIIKVLAEAPCLGPQARQICTVLYRFLQAQ